MQAIIRQTKYKMDRVKHRLLHNLFVSLGLPAFKTHTITVQSENSLICCIGYNNLANNVFDCQSSHNTIRSSLVQGNSYIMANAMHLFCTQCARYTHFRGGVNFSNFFCEVTSVGHCFTICCFCTKKQSQINRI